jgi:hypothetical protein
MQIQVVVGDIANTQKVTWVETCRNCVGVYVALLYFDEEYDDYM